MSGENAIGSILDIALAKMKEVAGSDTVIGTPITLEEGVTAIPVSKVSFGFAGGGSEFGKPNTDRFGGGAGGGVTVTPIAFLVSGEGGVRLMQLVDTKGSAVDNIIRTAPELVDKLLSLFKKDEPAQQE